MVQPPGVVTRVIAWQKDSQHMFRKLKGVDRRLSLEGNGLFLKSLKSEHIFKSASIGPDLPARQSDVR